MNKIEMGKAVWLTVGKMRYRVLSVSIHRVGCVYVTPHRVNGVAEGDRATAVLDTGIYKEIREIPIKLAEEIVNRYGEKKYYTLQE